MLNFVKSWIFREYHKKTLWIICKASECQWLFPALIVHLCGLKFDCDKTPTAEWTALDFRLMLALQSTLMWRRHGRVREVSGKFDAVLLLRSVHQFVISLSLQLKLKSMSTSAVLLYPFVVFSLRSRPMPSEVWHIRTFASLIGFTKSQNYSGASGANASWLRGPWCLLNSNDDRRLIKVIESDWCSLASDDLNWYLFSSCGSWHGPIISTAFPKVTTTTGWRTLTRDMRLSTTGWLAGCYGQASLETYDPVNPVVFCRMS